jgi:dTDP-4-amino-4,6-dideoxygalactose transaminase
MREAVADFIRVVDMRPGDSVLVPAYICAAVIEPFEKLGIKALFYPVGQTLDPDASAIRKLLPQRPRAILIVNYFGFPAAARAIIDECRANGLWIIEDCAHTLPMPANDIMGRRGDLTMYSLAKLLPVPDGALVVVNNPALGWLRPPDRMNRRLVLVNMMWQAANTLEVSLGVSIRTRLRDRRAASRMITALREPAVAISTAPPGNGAAVPYHRFQMSGVTNWIRGAVDLAAITQRRQNNYRWLSAAIKSIKGATPIFGDHEPPGAPLGFPLLVDNRDAVRLKLIAAGVDPRPIWSSLPAQVPTEGFAEARYIAGHNVVLPVHQDLTPAGLAHIVSSLEQAIASS